MPVSRPLAAHSTRKFLTCVAKGRLHIRRTDSITDARQKWNGERSDCVAVLIQHRKRNICDASHLVAGHSLVTSFAYPGQMPVEIAWQLPAGAPLPFRERAISHRALLKGKNQMTGGGVEKIDPRTELERESGCSGRVHLLDDNHFPVAQHGEVA